MSPVGPFRQMPRRKPMSASGQCGRVSLSPEPQQRTVWQAACYRARGAIRQSLGVARRQPSPSKPVTTRWHGMSRQSLSAFLKRFLQRPFLAKSRREIRFRRSAHDGVISDLDISAPSPAVMEAARTGARGQRRGWFGQGRPSGQRDPAGQPINASTGKTVLRFFVVVVAPESAPRGSITFHQIPGKSRQRACSA